MALILIYFSRYVHRSVILKIEEIKLLNGAVFSKPYKNVEQQKKKMGINFFNK